jgi:transcriptional regulator with XRE-family HTH domain
MPMGRTSAPPLSKEAVRAARLAKFMSQDDVCRACTERGAPLDQGNLSKIENGHITRPSLRLIPVLADVLGKKPEELFADEVAA